MSTYSYGGYEQERQRRAAERAAAPKQCPHCKTPINQNLSEWDKVRYHCGSDRCRQAAYRKNRAERKRIEREETNRRIDDYAAKLPQEQRAAIVEAKSRLMQFDYDQGHNIMWRVVQVVEAQRCRHDRIQQLEQNAALWQRRAEASERQLKERIAELEAELELFNGLQATIHGIAQRQLEKQPDPPAQTTPAPEAEPEDEDRARVLATLKQAGLKPYTGQEDQDGEEADDTEGYDEEDPEE